MIAAGGQVLSFELRIKVRKILAIVLMFLGLWGNYDQLKDSSSKQLQLHADLLITIR